MVGQAFIALSVNYKQIKFMIKKNIKLFLLLNIFLLSSCTNNKVVDLITSKNEQNNSEAQYVLGSEDIPLYTGLILLDEDSTNFDTMTGNIVISEYKGNVKSASIKDFYHSALPQLGWKLSKNKTDKVVYKRGDDKLEISFKKNGKDLNVKFFISSVLK